MASHLGAFLPVLVALGPYHARLASGVAMPEGPSWPYCQNSSVAQENTVVELWANVKKHGVTSGCKNDDCTKTDSFGVDGPERCSQVCYSVVGCDRWVFKPHGSTTAAGTCWLSTAGTSIDGTLQKATPAAGAITGSQTCIPVNWPECQFDGVSIDGGPDQALYLNLSEHDLAYDCTRFDDRSIKNCKERDQFAANGIEDCAAFCNKIPACMWWSYGVDDSVGLPVCLLRTTGHRKTVNSKFVSGKQWCSPVRVSRVKTSSESGAKDSADSDSEEEALVRLAAAMDHSDKSAEHMLAAATQQSNRTTHRAVARLAAAEQRDDRSANRTMTRLAAAAQRQSNRSANRTLARHAAAVQQSNQSAMRTRATDLARRSSGTLARPTAPARRVSRLRRKPAADLPECFLLSNQYSPLDMPGQPGTLETDIYACEARCASTDKCAHFSFSASGMCHLQNEAAEPRATPGYTSGEPGCEEVMASVPEEKPQNDSALSPPAKPAEEPNLPACVETGFRYSPLDMYGQHRTTEADAFACQARCARLDGCRHFTYWTNGGCHVQGANAKQSATSMQGIMTGPPVCEHQASAKRATPGKNDRFLNKVVHQVAREVKSVNRESGLTLGRGRDQRPAGVAVAPHSHGDHPRKA